ncbi:MAG TPA: hypothetical protein VFX33_10890 [Actinomycetales bacterium]|nr:hypothetical protein [Actinomycetales bacterium]
MSGSGIGWLLERPSVRVDAALTVNSALPRPSLERMRAEGLLVHLGAGIYLPADATCTTGSRAEAFATLVPPWAVLAMEAAAWVHGGPRPTPPFVLLTSATTGSRSAPEGTRLSVTPLPQADVVRVNGLRLTAPLRTVVDLARRGSGPTARAAFRWLLDQHVKPPELRAVLAEQSRYPGNRRARERLRALVRCEDDQHLWAEALSRSAPRSPAACRSGCR